MKEPNWKIFVTKFHKGGVLSFIAAPIILLLNYLFQAQGIDFVQLLVIIPIIGMGIAMSPLITSTRKLLPYLLIPFVGSVLVCISENNINGLLAMLFIYLIIAPMSYFTFPDIPSFDDIKKEKEEQKK